MIKNANSFKNASFENGAIESELWQKYQQNVMLNCA